MVCYRGSLIHKQSIGDNGKRGCTKNQREEINTTSEGGYGSLRLFRVVYAFQRFTSKWDHINDRIRTAPATSCVSPWLSWHGAVASWQQPPPTRLRQLLCRRDALEGPAISVAQFLPNAATWYARLRGDTCSSSRSSLYRQEAKNEAQTCDARRSAPPVFCVSNLNLNNYIRCIGNDNVGSGNGNGNGLHKDKKELEAALRPLKPVRLRSSPLVIL
jgi:hypothetical protein